MDPYFTTDLNDIENAVREFCSKEIEQDRLHDLEDRHAYIRDQGLEGALRDVRITSIYEGTGNIQKNAIAKTLF